LGFGYFYDINKPLPFLDVATANAHMAVSADECNAYASTSFASTSQTGPSAHPFLSDLQPPNAPGLQFGCYSKEIVPQPSGPRMNCVPLPPLSPFLELLSAPFAHADESTNEQYNYETLYFVANHHEPTTEQHQDTTPRSSGSSYHTAPESLSPQREHQSEMVPETLGM
jgi:hypothetical protein